MGLRMPSPTKRDGSSVFQIRERVPADIRRRVPEFPVIFELPAFGNEPVRTVSATARHQVKFSLGTRDPAAAKARSGIAKAHLEKLYASLRSGPTILSQKESVALSGEVYRLFVARFEENPGSVNAWTAVKAFNRAAAEGRLFTGPQLTDEKPYEAELAAEVFGDNLTAGINSMPASRSDASLEQRFGWLTDWVLTKHALNVDIESRRRLLQDVGRATTDAARRLRRNADGDFSPDPVADRFPNYEPKAGCSLTELFERWKAERKPSASTISTWDGYVRSLDQHVLGKPINRITPNDVISWKNELVASELNSKTINGGYLGAAHTLFAFAVTNRLISANPATGVKAAGKKSAGTSMQEYTDLEVAKLLELAKTAPPERRWLIWLAAATGARIGELAQLHTDRIQSISGIWAMHILPAEDGGSIKNAGSERIVPLHPILIEEGFLDFVKTKTPGPLFYGSRPREKVLVGSGPSKPRKHPSKGVTNHLGTWIREQGFSDKRKAPNHALRHWWKSAAHRAGVSDSIADAIQGHAPRGAAATYRHFKLEDFATAIGQIPIPLANSYTSTLGE